VAATLAGERAEAAAVGERWAAEREATADARVRFGREGWKQRECGGVDEAGME
jgi:hypothetical protein